CWSKKEDVCRLSMMTVPCPDVGDPDDDPEDKMDAGEPPTDPSTCSSGPQECTTSGGEGQVCFEGGVFELGTDASGFHASPAHAVYVSPFWMDTTEVTVGEYRACVAAGYCYSPVGDPYFQDHSNDDKPMVGLD